MTKYRELAHRSLYFKGSSDAVTNLENLTMLISDMFALKLEELKRKNEESERRTQELIERTRGLIKELEAINLDSEF